MVIKKDKFTFGSILDESIQDYKKNFGEIFKFMLIFVGIPALIFCLIEFSIYVVDSNLLSIFSTPSILNQLNEGIIKLPLYYRIITSFFSLITICLTVFVSAGFISTTLKKSKFSFNELIDNGLSKYGKFFLFNIVLIIFLLLLSLLLIIPGIIFGIYWAFASYIFFDKKEKILSSLKQSRKIVKNRWWKTFGYLLLISIILVGLSILINIIQFPTLIISGIHILNDTPLSLTLLGISSLLGVIASFFASLISMPMAILFFKNFYRKMKL
jgi:hypothetical protein